MFYISPKLCKCKRCYNLCACVVKYANLITSQKKLTASAQASNATTEMSSHLDVDDLDASVSRSVAENNDPDSLVV